MSFCEHELRSSRNSKRTFFFLRGVLFPVTAAGRCPSPMVDSKETGAM